MENRIEITQNFAHALNKGLRNRFGKSPSSAGMATQFNLRARGTKTISRETARKWTRGLAFPDPGRLQVLIKWLNLNMEEIYSGAFSGLTNHASLKFDAEALVTASHNLRQSELLAQASLNAISHRTAVLDEAGVIILVNTAWRSHAVSNSNGISYKYCCEGSNYLYVCDNVRGSDSEYAAKMAAGIRAVMRRERIEFALKYPCGDMASVQWFIGRVFNFADIHGVCTVVTHEAIAECGLPDYNL